MWPDKTVPIVEADIDFEYDWAVCREGDRTINTNDLTLQDLEVDINE